MVSSAATLVPKHRREMTAAWLTQALHSTGTITPGTRVTACAHQPVLSLALSGEAREDGGGLSGPHIERLHLTYSDGTGPSHMVVKFGNWADKQQMPPWPLKTRLIQVVGDLRLEDQFRSEITFFRDIRPHITSVLLPQVYYVGLVDAPNVNAWSFVLFDTRTPLRFCILMEDLGRGNFTPGKPGASLSPAQAEHALRNIAKLHAFGWRQPQLWEQLRLRPTPWLTFLRADAGQQRQQRDTFCQHDFMPTFLQRWAHHPRIGNHPEGFAMLRDPEVVAMLTALNASFARWATDAAQTAYDEAQTIVHGDFHGWNHLFNPQDECRVVDFQFFGKGRVADEVAYFFMTSFDPAPDAEHALLTSYHTALVEAGVEAYPFEQFLHEYHVATLTLLLGSIVRATKFIKPAAYDKMGQDPKQADLMEMSDMARDRLLARALHWYRTPHLRARFFSAAAARSVPGR